MRCSLRLFSLMRSMVLLLCAPVAKTRFIGTSFFFHFHIICFTSRKRRPTCFPLYNTHAYSELLEYNDTALHRILKTRVEIRSLSLVSRQGRSRDLASTFFCLPMSPFANQQLIHKSLSFLSDVTLEKVMLEVKTATKPGNPKNFFLSVLLSQRSWHLWMA